MTEKKTYRVVSPSLNLVLFVKAFSPDEERDVYNKIRGKVEAAEGLINITEYKEFIVKHFLVDHQGFLDDLPEDYEDDLVEAYDSAYEAIVELYPPFSIDFICTDLNTTTFMTGIGGKILEQLRKKAEKNQTPPPSNGLSSIEQIESAKQFFEDNIIGQKKAIDTVIKGLKLTAAGLADHNSFLFVGPTGVGKTQLGKLLGEVYGGNFYKVNCAEFAGGHEYAKLIGSPPGYVGHTEKSLLAEKAEKSNQWVFLFDEIEKAHHKLYDFLLSLLDDGTCTDNMGAVLDFSKSIFIFTSNKGMDEVKTENLGFASLRTQTAQETNKQTEHTLIKSVKNHFSPEFLNRIDDIVVFNSLTKQNIKDIAELQLEELPIEKTKSLVDYVVENAYSKEYGARNIARFIKNNISVKVADAILNKEVPVKDGTYYTPRIVKGEVKIINTKKYEELCD